jgi:hypothetical protein
MAKLTMDDLFEQYIESRRIRKRSETTLNGYHNKWNLYCDDSRHIAVDLRPIHLINLYAKTVRQ